MLGGEKQIAADPREVGVDPLLRADALDARDCGPVAVAREPRTVDAMETDHLLIPVVDDVRQVRSGHAGLPTSGRAVIDQDDGLLLASEQVGSRDTCDAGADDTHIGSRVLTERRLPVRMSGFEPERRCFHTENRSKRRTDTWHSRC